METPASSSSIDNTTELPVVYCLENVMTLSDSLVKAADKEKGEMHDKKNANTIVA